MNLPKIAMGAWAWGDTDGYFGNTMTAEDFRPIFEAAVNKGLNLWDTATAYSNGESEKILGKLTNDIGRDKVIISTKFTPQMAEMYGNSVVKMCEASLKRMNMEYFDIYWIHNPIGAPEYTKQLIPLLQSGKVKSVGVSNHNLAQIKEADKILKAAGFRVSAIQNHYSLSGHSVIIKRCNEYQHIGIKYTFLYLLHAILLYARSVITAGNTPRTGADVTVCRRNNGYLVSRFFCASCKFICQHIGRTVLVGTSFKNNDLHLLHLQDFIPFCFPKTGLRILPTCLRQLPVLLFPLL